MTDTLLPMTEPLLCPECGARWIAKGFVDLVPRGDGSFDVVTDCRACGVPIRVILGTVGADGIGSWGVARENLSARIVRTG